MLAALARTAASIRALELQLLKGFTTGALSGTLHTCVGQELGAAALQAQLDLRRDAFFGSHRCHGHYLAAGGPVDGLIAELMGHEGAVCRGRGGSQHLHWERFFSNGIQGGMAGMAVGFAWALRRRGEEGIVAVQVGDGTFGEGALHEAFGLAALLPAPVLFFVEYNGVAQSTDVSTTTPGDLVQRVLGFGLEVDRRSDRDPLALHDHLGEVVRTMRRTGRPFVQIVDTRRLLAHSRGDDHRPAELIERLRREDPLSTLLEQDARLAAAFRAACTDAEQSFLQVGQRPAIADAATGRAALPPGPQRLSTRYHAELETAAPVRVVEELNATLARLMAATPEVLLVGEDLADPYGGAFKVTRGLSTRFPRQVFSSPISEAGITALGNGLALAGARPVVELMFADFVTLAMDQLVNHAAKLHYMYGGTVTCPVTVRLVSGGGRGYGPTHSQSLERMLCGVPGLRVVALSLRHRPGRLLEDVVLDDDAPTVLVENKRLYAKLTERRPPLDLSIRPASRSNGHFPPLYYGPADGGRPELTVVTYGGMTETVEAAMRELMLDEELRFDYVVLTQLWPLDCAEVVASCAQTGRLVVVDEGVASFGVGSAVAAAVLQRLPAGVPLTCRIVGARELPIPCARHLEEQVLPSAADVVQAMRSCAGLSEPGERYVVDVG